MTPQERAEVAANMALEFLAVMNSVELGATVGAMIATAASIGEKTPLQLLDALRAEMPTDEHWNAQLAERTARKVRNARRWYRGAKIEFVGRGNQG